MKFYELPESVQVVAAQLLKEKIENDLRWQQKEKRTEMATEYAETIRQAFEKLSS